MAGVGASIILGLVIRQRDLGVLAWQGHTCSSPFKPANAYCRAVSIEILAVISATTYPSVTNGDVASLDCRRGCWFTSPITAIANDTHTKLQIGSASAEAALTGHLHGVLDEHACAGSIMAPWLMRSDCVSHSADVGKWYGKSLSSGPAQIRNKLTCRSSDRPCRARAL